jgi:hypothetical protein
MYIKVLNHAGYSEAMLGLSLSYGIDTEKAYQVANKLCRLDGGHNNFLEQIWVWVEIDAPRFWWSEMDRYRVGKSQQSESTMHTLSKRNLRNDDFEYPIPDEQMFFLNRLIKDKGNIEFIKANLPEGFMQRRIVSMNYKCLRNIVLQRYNHKLPQWRKFCREIVNNVKGFTLLGLPEDVLLYMKTEKREGI